jgi:hypothetical protein
LATGAPEGAAKTDATKGRASRIEVNRVVLDNLGGGLGESWKVECSKVMNE